MSIKEREVIIAVAVQKADECFSCRFGQWRHGHRLARTKRDKANSGLWMVGTALGTD